MGELRSRMIRDMTVRGFAARTHKSYLAAVVRLAKHYRRSPDQITDDEIQTYLAYLIQERKLSWSTCSQAANAFRFLYHVTLGHPRTDFQVPLPKQPQKLHEILSREEVWRLRTASPHPRHRLLLTTIYATGLRVSEAIALKVSDIDADRMTIRVEQGKGAKDRYVPLAKRLLHELQAYWKTTPPGVWRTRIIATRDGAALLDVPVQLNVVPAALPDTLQFTVCLDAEQSPAQVAGIDESSPAAWEAFERYHRLAHLHRTTLAVIPYGSG